MIDLFFFFALGITSFVAVFFIAERGLALRWDKVVPPPVERAAEEYAQSLDTAALRHACEGHASSLSRLLLSCIEHLRWPREENVDALETRARHEVAVLERGLVVLEIIVGIAPLLGLVGTVFGLIRLFSGMSQHGLGEYTHLAQGIGLALYTTLMGLLIAIPALIAWSYYNKKVETLAIEMENICDDFLRQSYRAKASGGKAKSSASHRPEAEPQATEVVPKDRIAKLPRPL